MTIADKIKGVFSGHKDTEPTGTATGTTTGTHMGTGTGTGTGTGVQHSGVTTQQRTVRAPDHHVPEGTAAGRIVLGRAAYGLPLHSHRYNPCLSAVRRLQCSALTKELSG